MDLLLHFINLWQRERGLQEDITICWQAAVNASFSAQRSRWGRDSIHGDPTQPLRDNLMLHNGLGDSSAILFLKAGPLLHQASSHLPSKVVRKDKYPAIH